MHYVLNHLRKNKFICIIVFLFLLAKILTISAYKTVWWDSAVYVGMGKYVYSLANSGLWESSRPIIWPLMLGFFWKIGLDAIFVGRIAEIIFGGLCILLTYMIGKKLFEDKTALVASLLLALSPTFFFFNGIMLTEIVSTFFVLLAIYLLLSQKKFLSGFFFAIAFLARFLQVLAFLAAVLSIFIYRNKKNIQALKKMFLGFALAIIPFLILNQILYNNILEPFIQQIFLTKNSGWFNYHPLSYYFIELFKENFLYLFSIIGFIILIRKKEVKKMPILLAFFLCLIFFNLIRQKEMRFLIVLFPYMYLLISYTLTNIADYFNKKSVKSIIFLLIGFSVLLSINSIGIYYKNEANKPNQYKILQEKLNEISPDSKIWVSNPVISVYSDAKIDKLMYYPVFNEQKKNELIGEYERADFILLDSCDLECRQNDFDCENNRKLSINFLKQKLKTVFSSSSSQCGQFIFQK